MKLKKFAVSSALAIAALSVTAGTAYATPAQNPAPVQNTIGHHTAVEGRSVVTVLEFGGFHLTSDGKFVELRNDAGAVLQTLPLTIQFGGKEYSIAPLIENQGRTLTLTPETDPAKATAVDVAAPVSDVAAPFDFSPENLEKLSAGVGNAVTIGSLIGTVVGAVVGCVAGPAGCVAGITTGAGIGGVLGTIAGGGTVLAGNGSAMLNAPA
ncbi:hypothetical protein [Prescottella subtropica]|uniref:hypothetical protein n=1 Tax=Prescottella subtropica TaxID=2545757 RepID=UPI0010F8BDEE|nr:hypothetical protein [Prescottella subtropica]